MIAFSKSDVVRERTFDRKEGKRNESNPNQLEKRRERAGGRVGTKEYARESIRERGHLYEKGEWVGKRGKMG
jgi:hypothetical protein